MTGRSIAWPIVPTVEIAAQEKGAIVSGPFGSAISSKYFEDVGTPVIRGNNLTLGVTRFVDNGFVFLGDQKTHQFRNMKAVAGDIIFTAAGTLGQVGIIPEDSRFPFYIISNKQLRLRVDRKKVDPIYAYYWYSSPEIRQQIIASNRGSSVPLITLQVLRSLPIAIPALDIQCRIAAILSAYDDLIENNKRRIAILEEKARRIYEEWFVHFRAPGCEGLPLVDSPLGPIPVGWAATVSVIADYINRGIAPRYDETSQTVVINQKCIREGRLSLEPARPQSKPVPAEKLARHLDVLINSTGVGTLGRVAQAFRPPSGCTVDSHVTIARPRLEVDPHFFGLTLMRLQSKFEAAGVGSTGQTELSRDRIRAETVVNPPHSLQRAFGEKIEPMRELAQLLSLQNGNLRAQRDFLLPKLISGEFDVSAAEQLLEAAE